MPNLPHPKVATSWVKVARVKEMLLEHAWDGHEVEIKISVTGGRDDDLNYILDKVQRLLTEGL